MKISKVAVIGAGNVGLHLAHRLQKERFRIVQVFSRTESHAVELAKLVGAKPITSLEELAPEADLYIIAVPDNAIEQVAAEIRVPGKLVVHTSGSISSEVLKNCSENYGVFYPLQSFSRELGIRWKNIPVIVYSNQLEVVRQLEWLGMKISKDVLMLNDEERQYLHLAAVFINNFTNHMGVIAKDILEEKKIDFDLLKPLMRETVRKVFTGEPINMQTGPAHRGDDKVIEKHLQMIEGLLHYKEVYRMVSGSIMKRGRQENGDRQE